ncbi:bromodomain containing protein protein, putative [Babesia ovis]|uniref:Bromodomain containing protein protein, putative n=1 Tax=Babesia ovis TaxID=5869 RepID=A0A9W5TEH3_BABOV|nr:bromodomain containing protein protein, putative [Babesia ovis]
MSEYVLVSQDVSAALDFERKALCGWTRLVFQRRGEEPTENDDGGTTQMLALSIPTIEHSNYKGAIVNGEEAVLHLAKTVDPAGNPEAVNRACTNVDLLTFDGIQVMAQQVCDGMLYVEVKHRHPELSVELHFEYLHLENITEDVYFSTHWLLPRCTTSYREYCIFTSSPGSDKWFPSAMLNKGVGIAPDCVYRIEVTLPARYTAVCGMPRDDGDSAIRSTCAEAPIHDNGLDATNSADADETVVGDTTAEITTVDTDHNGQSDVTIVNNPVDTVVHRFKWVTTQQLAVFPGNRFGLYAGEFEFWDGIAVQQQRIQMDSEKGRRILEDEDCIEEYGKHLPTEPGNQPLVYVTLKGYGFLLEPSNIVTEQCLETYRKLLDVEGPSMVYLLFLPLQPFPLGGNVAAHLRTQNFIDIKRCTAFTGSESVLHHMFNEPLVSLYHGMYHSKGNVLLCSIDILHSYSDIDHDPRSVDSRLVLAYGLSSLFTLGTWVNPSRDMHLDLMLQSYLVDQFIKRSMGNNELKVRLWARREAFATITEIYGDCYPLCQTKGMSVSSQVLLADRAYTLKCHLLPAVLDTLFSASNFLPDNFFIEAMKRRLAALSSCCNVNTVEPNCEQRGQSKFATWSDGNMFWSMVGDDMVKRYINVWNAKPPNRLVLQNQIDPHCKLEEIVRRGVEHDHLNNIMKQYQSLIHSFVYGTGCPQMNMGFSLQLQRKGTSMDHLNFRVDVKSLQPPLDIQKDGSSAYTLCRAASLSAKNLYETYSKLSEILQLQEQSEDHTIGSRTKIFERMMQLYGISSDDNCPLIPHVLDFADIANPITIAGSSEAGMLRRNMSLLQMWHDPVDLVGRDGNFLMGFGYIGPFPHGFCLGNGPLYDCVEMARQHCDVNSMIETYVDNGSTYCGAYTYKNGFERIMGKGSMPVASNGGIPFWQLIHQQEVMINPDNGSLPLSAGFSKQWISTFKVDIVEDDGVRENVKVLGDMVPASYKVNPRAERGRKKVAIKGVPDKDLDDMIDDTQRKSSYIGHHSDSDRMVIEWMKMLFIGIHPELAQLDNRSVVAKICSKIRLPMLWMSADSGFRLIARIRRCQSSSMWEQQLLSDNNIYGQMDAAAALGSFGRSVNYTTCENPIVHIAISKLELMIRRHRIHPSVRARCLYSLACLHNRDYREQNAIQSVFANYLKAFSLNNTGANYWHPSEARFMLDFFRALSLLRNRMGYSPQMVIDMFSKVLEGMNGLNYLVHATNIVECCSYLAIPPCALKHMEQGIKSCMDIKRLWELLWHLFRLDGIPGSGSSSKMLSAAFLRCISRQPLLLQMCKNRFRKDKDIGFEFDFYYFIPLLQNVHILVQGAFELGQTYYSKQVHIAAIEALLRVVMMGSYIIDYEEDMDNRTMGTMKMVKVDHNQQIERLQQFAGVLDATNCCIALCQRLTERDLVIYAWNAYARLIEELSQSHPVLFINLDTAQARQVRDLLYQQLRPYAVSRRPYNLEIYIHIRSAILLLFGPGYVFEGDPAPDQKLVTQRLELITSGLSMPRIAAFRRMHGDGGCSGTIDWVEVAVEAIGALKELPQARWFIHDPELSIVGYRSMVRHPMWFAKIEQKALSGQYTIPMQFKADVALVFKNAKSVNKADSMPYADALVVEGQFDTLWPAIVRTFQRNAKAARS